MEYFELGDLEKYITPKLTEEDAKMIGRQLFEGLEILHGYNWAHRDIKPKNIFVVRDAPQWWIKIGDFGMSKLAEQSGIHTQVGTHDYMAPELFWGNYDDTDDEETLPFTIAIDTWSLGCVLFRLLTGQQPFVSPSLLRRYYRSKISFPVDALKQNDVSADGIAILSELMKPRPADRMNVSAALLHSWTSVREPTLKRPVPAGHESSSKIIEEIPWAELQLKTHASNVGNDGDKGSRLISGTAAKLKTPKDRNLSNLDAPVGYKKLDKLRRELGEIPWAELQLKTHASNVGNDGDKGSRLISGTAAKLKTPKDRNLSNLDAPVGYKKLDKLRRELGLNERMFETQKRELGEEHPTTLRSMANLSLDYYRVGQYRDATQLGKQIIEVQKRMLGAEHPSTLLFMHNLAWSYHSRGQNKRAVQLGEQTVEVRKRVLGAGHPNTLVSMQNLARYYRCNGQYERAVHLGEQTVKVRKRVLGAEHPSTLGSMYDLTRYYDSHGQYERAVQLGEQTVEVRKRVLGAQHPDTLQSARYLAKHKLALRRDQSPGWKRMLGL